MAQRHEFRVVAQQMAWEKIEAGEVAGAANLAEGPELSHKEVRDGTKALEVGQAQWHRQMKRMGQKMTPVGHVTGQKVVAVSQNRTSSPAALETLGSSIRCDNCGKIV
jgi:hypothetical protein